MLQSKNFSSVVWFFLAFNVLVIWPLASVFTLLGTLIGIPIVAVTAALGKMELKPGHQGPAWFFTVPWVARWFETPDNGALPLWYDVACPGWWPAWLRVTMWCGFRNSFSGNPLHIHTRVPTSWAGNTSNHPHKESLLYFYNTGKYKWYWQVVEYFGWCGFWAAIKMGPLAQWFFRKLGRKPVGWAHWEIRFGWKGSPEQVGASFTPWDCGPRLR
jgi:hypothetical protein